MLKRKQKNIVLLHGWGASRDKLEPLAGSLRKSGWSTFVPGLPGFDLQPPKSAWNLDKYSRYVLRKTGSRYSKKDYYVFGHSFGGRIAIKIAQDPPNNLKGVVLCNTSGISRTNVVKRTVFLILAKLGKSLLLIKPLANFYKVLLYKFAREHDYEKAKDVMKQVFKKVISEDLSKSIVNIKLPLLVLWGRDDRMTPVRDAYYIKRKLPYSRLVVFDDIGHKLPYKKPNNLAREIDKWKKRLK
jgi:pimeloyl-ACP methyl ester carboxylesterase